jgi:hypothetical protein
MTLIIGPPRQTRQGEQKETPGAEKKPYPRALEREIELFF